MINSLYYLAQTANDLSWLRLPTHKQAIPNSVASTVMIVLAAIALVVGVFLYIRSRLRAPDIVKDLDQARMKVLTDDLNLSHSELELVQTLRGTTSTAELLNVMESRDRFEDMVQRFREANPGHLALRRVSHLRQHLQFGFSNARNPFKDTRMLAPGMRLRCIIKLPKRQVSFLTTVLAVNESQFVIRPPTAKGKPQPLGKLPQLGFRVSRDHDAEYAFTCPVQGQLDAGTPAVLCGHTREIRRLLFRDADRVQVDLPAECFLIRQEIAGDRAATSLRAQDAQFRFNAQIRDISIGGARLLAEVPEGRVSDGDMIIFGLSAARLQFDLVAQAVGMVARDAQHMQIHLQFLGLREMDRLKLGKYLVSMKEKGAPVMPSTKPYEPSTQRAT